MLKFHVDYISHSGKKAAQFFSGFGGSGPRLQGQFFIFLFNCFFPHYGYLDSKNMVYPSENQNYPIPNHSENITVFLNLHH